jgi:hypothetical protein
MSAEAAAATATSTAIELVALRVFFTCPPLSRYSETV